MKDDEKIWTARQRQFILWLSLPQELRELDERTETQFADKHKIGTVTLWRWKKLPGFWGEVAETSKQFLGDALPEGLRSFKEQVRRGSFQHQKMYLEMMGLYREPVQRVANTDSEGNDKTDLSDAELIDRASAIIERRARGAT